MGDPRNAPHRRLDMTPEGGPRLAARSMGWPGDGSLPQAISGAATTDQALTPHGWAPETRHCTQ